VAAEGADNQKGAEMCWAADGEAAAEARWESEVGRFHSYTHVIRR